MIGVSNFHANQLDRHNNPNMVIPDFQVEVKPAPVVMSDVIADRWEPKENKSWSYPKPNSDHGGWVCAVGSVEQPQMACF